MESCKKHACPDCTFCQFCSETRCRACRRRSCPRDRMSIAEQIELYESLNRNAGAPYEPIFYSPKNRKATP